VSVPKESTHAALTGTVLPGEVDVAKLALFGEPTKSSVDRDDANRY
jgi:hypothetical protein